MKNKRLSNLNHKQNSHQLFLNSRSHILIQHHIPLSRLTSKRHILLSWVRHRHSPLIRLLHQRLQPQRFRVLPIHPKILPHLPSPHPPHPSLHRLLLNPQTHPMKNQLTPRLRNHPHHNSLPAAPHHHSKIPIHVQVLNHRVRKQNDLRSPAQVLGRQPSQMESQLLPANLHRHLSRHAYFLNHPSLLQAQKFGETKLQAVFPNRVLRAKAKKVLLGFSEHALKNHDFGDYGVCAR